MLKFNEEALTNSISGALKLRTKINTIIESVHYDNICFMGVGATYASCMQVVDHMKMLSSLEVILQQASEYYTTGNKRINENTLVIISSVSGTTKEMILAVLEAKHYGATVLGFIDTPNTKLANIVDYCITYPGNESLKLFMTADYIMYKRKELKEYKDIYTNFDKYLPSALVETALSADAFAKEFAKIHCEDPIHYFVGSGYEWEEAYRYSASSFEMKHWLKAKAVHAGEFFHGMFEVIDKNTNITVFIGEDKQRILGERVSKFLPQICARYTLIDTKDYPLTGIKAEYRGYISHLVIQQICNRIDVYIEQINCHPTSIRRYYNQLEY